MNAIMRNGFVPLRAADVSADDTAMDTSTAGTTFWDMTRKDCYELQPTDNGIEVIFLGEGDDTDYFGCRVFGKSPGGPAQALCEISGHYGAAMATVDATAYHMAETILLEASNCFRGDASISVSDCSGDRAASLNMASVWGFKHLYFEFYNVGDTTEVHNITPYGRTY
jgi:hypothetical protein